MSSKKSTNPPKASPPPHNENALFKISWVKISEIKLNPDNPRVIKDKKFEKLVASIREFPKMLAIRPIVVNSDMVVLGGNMRLRACKDANLKIVPVLFASTLTEEEQKEFMVKDNVGFGEWDFEILANQYDPVKISAWGLDSIESPETQEKKKPKKEKPDKFLVVIECKNDDHQQTLYDEFSKRGLSCRIAQKV